MNLLLVDPLTFAFMCVWSFFKGFVRRPSECSLVCCLNCVWFHSVVSLLVGVHVTGMWTRAAVSLILETFFFVFFKWLLHMHINPYSPVFTMLPFAVYDDCVYCVCAQLVSQAWHSSWLSCPSLPVSPPPAHLPFHFLTLPPPHKAKVRELEEKCRTQSEQFNLLSKELEKFRLHAGKFDILSTEPLTVCESPGSPNKSLSQLLNGLAGPIGKGRIIPPTFGLLSHQYFKAVFEYLIINYWCSNPKSFQNVKKKNLLCVFVCNWFVEQLYLFKII